MRSAVSLAWAAKFGIHIAVLGASFLLAYTARIDLPAFWWLDFEHPSPAVGWACLFALIGGAVEGFFQAERAAWRFASARDVVALARNATLTTALFLLAVFFLDRGQELPRSVLPLAWLFSIVNLVAARMLWRLPREGSLADQLLPPWWRRATVDRPPLILVGTMSGADRQLRHLLADPEPHYQPCGVITPHAQEVGVSLHGVPFLGTLEQWRRGELALPSDGAAAFLFLDDPIKAFGLSPARVGELRRVGHKLLRPSALSDLGESDASSARLEEIPLEEFLPRQPIALSPKPVAELIRGKRVLVTGAGGSIGSEIARQMGLFGCAHLTLLDHSEYLLFEIDRELAGTHADMSRRAFLANVRDEARIRDLFDRERPDIVFHAAALKHVSLVENNPAEGVLTNVQGTWNVIRAAIAAHTAQFVLISTDKAVDPSSVMGATKRIAEALLEHAPSSSTKLSAVRFGNVLGSAGSVVPIFRDQISRGGPVTVTHPEVNRYFMTIPEAVQLVLHSAALKAARMDEGPSKFLLEMGKPVRIVDLARQMIELSGKTPGIDIKIEFTGLKQGEKIAEILADDGEEPRLCVEGILEVTKRGDARRLDASRLERLACAALNSQNEDVVGLVSEIVSRIRA